MACVLLDISDGANHFTLKAMLEADGHTIAECCPGQPSGGEPDVIVTDDAVKAIPYAKGAPTLVLTPAGRVRAAVAAMRQGVYGYVFLPLQPGEVELMVRRASAEDIQESPMLTLSEIEARHIRSVLRQCKNNRARAARILGIGRNTLWRKLKTMDVE